MAVVQHASFNRTTLSLSVFSSLPSELAALPRLENDGDIALLLLFGEKVAF